MANALMSVLKEAAVWTEVSVLMHSQRDLAFRLADTITLGVALCMAHTVSFIISL